MDNRLHSNSDKYHITPPDHPSPMKTESRPGTELKDKKLQKADREKLRRDRLNDQFTELGKTLDPERPKFDKATILNDTIQMLNDLTAQVNRLKSEYIALTEESHELTREKHDLREEKASLKSDIENLKCQYQHRARAMYPWGHMDQSVVMHPPSYPYPVPLQMPIPPASIPMHPSIHPPYPFFGNQNPGSGVVSNAGSTFFQYMSPAVQPSGRSDVSSRQSSRSKSSAESGSGKDGVSNNVATELELKTPGSTSDQTGETILSRVGSLVHVWQHDSPAAAESKSNKSQRKEDSISDGSSPSGCSSSGTVQVSSSNSVNGGTNRY